MRTQADKKRTHSTLEVGDWVLVRLHPYRQSSLAKIFHYKLSQKFYGPFQITRKISDTAYTLALPEERKIHPTFHISKL